MLAPELLYGLFGMYFLRFRAYSTTNFLVILPTVRV